MGIKKEEQVYIGAELIQVEQFNRVAQKYHTYIFEGKYLDIRLRKSDHI
jgi:hypothetical protein